MTWKPVKPVALPQLLAATNVCDLLDKDDLAAVGRKVMEGYTEDVASRADWEKRQANANKLALQVMESKTDPWPNASNMKFPLVTVAALQFASRAYPTLFSGVDLVKVKVIGDDPTGEKKARGERIATHMSWQNLEQDPAWEEDSDKLCLVVAIAGCAFRKRVFEPGPQRQVSMLVLPRHLVLNYWTRSLDDSPRFTHTFYLDANQLRQRELDRRYRRLPQEEGSLLPQDDANRDGPVRPDAQVSDSEGQQAADQRQGITKPQEDAVTPWFTGEQYCWLDLDADGYEEPYIVTVDIGTGVVRRIVARFLPSGVKFADGSTLTQHARPSREGPVEYDLPDSEVYKITPVRIFTKYGFIPSPDGGFYDLGLGSLEGPLNASVNSIINQMIDQGTMYTLGGGFLGRAFKGRGGPLTFAPNQWHTLDAPGDDIRKSILPNPIKEPSQTLFHLLGLIIQYAERIVSANDIQVGEQDMQNQKAETTRILNENGQRVYSGIYKRLWRCLRNEFRVQYDLNSLFLAQDVNYEELTSGKTALIHPDDYSESSLSVRPAADPHIVSDGEAQKQALTVVQLAGSSPGFNRYRANLRLLKALKVPNIEEIYPPPKDPKTGRPLPDYPMPPNPKMLDAQVKMQKVQLDAMKLQAQQRQDQLTAMLDARKELAEIDQLKANTAKLLAEAKAAESDPAIKLLFAQIEAGQKRADRLLEYAKLIDQRMERMNDGSAAEDNGQRGMAGAESQPGAAALPPGNGAIAPGQLGSMGL